MGDTDRKPKGRLRPRETPESGRNSAIYCSLGFRGVPWGSVRWVEARFCTASQIWGLYQVFPGREGLPTSPHTAGPNVEDAISASPRGFFCQPAFATGGGSNASPILSLFYAVKVIYIKDSLFPSCASPWVDANGSAHRFWQISTG